MMWPVGVVQAKFWLVVGAIFQLFRWVTVWW